MERVDEVRTNLERLHDEAATPQRPDQSQRDRRLADAAVRPRDDDRAQRLRVLLLRGLGGQSEPKLPWPR